MKRLILFLSLIIISGIVFADKGYITITNQGNCKEAYQSCPPKGPCVTKYAYPMFDILGFGRCGATSDLHRIKGGQHYTWANLERNCNYRLYDWVTGVKHRFVVGQTGNTIVTIDSSCNYNVSYVN